MLRIPTLTTGRLHLRPFEAGDAAQVQLLCSDERVAGPMGLPLPYPEGAATEFIQRSRVRAVLEEGFALAIVHTETAQLIGSTGCHTTLEHGRARISFWTGVSFWGRGFATEGAAALLHYLFTHLDVHRVTADHFAANAAPGRVMQKLGMTHEGTSRQNFRYNAAYHDDHHYAILRDEYLAGRSKAEIASHVSG